ncbi:hypothetical protein [Salinigranum marinum]|uniref:hypothetical protein n=1 Tax=Salinigranum marinum TaxID=1515595 RepID=UPI002989B9AC|nr:hypothetical protein [Salinigranum marinum]
MNVVDKDDYVELLLAHASQGTWEVTGHVRHRTDNEAIIDVKSPAHLGVITISDLGPWDEKLTAFRDQTSIRIGSVEVVRLLKITSLQSSNRRLSATVGDK